MSGASAATIVYELKSPISKNTTNSTTTSIILSAFAILSHYFLSLYKTEILMI